jgi:hypothetical protein
MQKQFKIQQSMSLKELKESILLDKDTYEDKDAGILELCLSWYQKNPLVYTVIKCNDEVIGYINFLPLKKSCYMLYKSGKIHDWQIKPKDIDNYIPNNAYNCLLTSIVLKEEYRDGQTVKLLWNGFLEKLQNFKKQNINIDYVLADCVSDDGEKFVKKLGFYFVCEHEGGKIFEGKINL